MPFGTLHFKGPMTLTPKSKPKFGVKTPSQNTQLQITAKRQFYSYAVV